MTQSENHDRRHWGRWLLITALALCVLLVAAHGLWSLHAGRVLRHQVAVYRAAGEPIEPGDFASPSVPDDDNIAIALRQASEIDDTTPAWKAYDELNPQTPLTDREASILKAVLAENGKAFEDIESAMQRGRLDWQISFRSPVIFTMLPDLTRQRQLAMLVKCRALLRHRAGDDSGAIQDLLRVRFISIAVGGQPMLISHLVAQGMRGAIIDAIQDMAPSLKVGNKRGEVSPKQLENLIAALLNDRPRQEELRRGLLGERMEELDSARCIADGRLSLSGQGRARGGSGAGTSTGAALMAAMIRPIARQDGLIMIRHTTAILGAEQKSENWPSFKSVAPPARPPQVAKSPTFHAVATIFQAALERTVQTYYASSADARLAACALAVRWYASDHAGRLPKTLNELVPTYLPSVPLDPMTTDQPIRYIGGGSDPRLYSVGLNGRDDGGSDAMPTKHVTLDKWQKLDAVVHLTPQPREFLTAEEEEAAGVAPSIDLPATTPTTQSTP